MKDYGHVLVSAGAKKLADAGVLVNMGAHGQLQGLGAHWEMWMLAQGGMAPMDVLREATITRRARSASTASWNRSSPASWPISSSWIAIRSRTSATPSRCSG
jgi:hypothetical protein